MKLNLIMDGNYLLSRLVFTLQKNNLLYGALYLSLENTISNYKKIYPYNKIYMVSDSKEKSWRKTILSEYKSTRKKDSDIDWDFVYKTYNEFKSNLSGVKLLESPGIEGDDWISFVVNETNNNNESNMIISNDYDIKQLVSFNFDNLWINFMTNEMFNQEKVFLPKNYQIFIDKVNKLPNNDIFNLNDNNDFINMFDKFNTKYQIVEVNPIESLISKVISGDVSDNIKSVYQVTKNGKTRGIGNKGSLTMIESYISEFGELSLNDPDLYENIADIICEKKKLPKNTIGSIIERIDFNMKLIDLRIDSLPKNISNNMKKIFNNEV